MDNIAEYKKIQDEIKSEIAAIEAERINIYNRPGSGFEDEKLIVNVSYPYSDTWDYETYIRNINLDERRKKGIESGRDFEISAYTAIQKEIKAENGIFSPKFGQTLSDMEPFIDRYKCSCGKTKYAVHEGVTCPYCGTKVKFVGDDFGCFGWIILDHHYLIHPNLYKNIESLVGGPIILTNMLDYYREVDEDGHIVPQRPKDPESAKEGNKASNRRLKNIRRTERAVNRDEPFYGIGMLEFYLRFDEIMDYYLNNSSNKAAKKKIYDKIYEDRDKVFTQSIPVYTTHLRPYELSKDRTKFVFEGTNAIYNMMSKLRSSLNNSHKYKMSNHEKYVANLLWSLQREWNDLYSEIDKILSGKKGNVRLLSGGRTNFSGRSVIIQNPRLRADQVILPYPFLVTILEQQIINVLTKTYGIIFNDAYNRWFKSIDEPDKTIIQIIYGLINSKKEGLPVIINRNPSIQRGSLLQMFCIDMSFNYTMSIPLAVLSPLVADFDGDVLNIFYIVNEAFYRRCYQVLNPRNSMYISNNDGRVNKDLLPFKDTLINANTFRRLGIRHYTKEQLQAITEFKLKNGIK